MCSNCAGLCIHRFFFPPVNTVNVFSPLIFLITFFLLLSCKSTVHNAYKIQIRVNQQFMLLKRLLVNSRLFYSYASGGSKVIRGFLTARRLAPPTPTPTSFTCQLPASRASVLELASFQKTVREAVCSKCVYIQYIPNLHENKIFYENPFRLAQSVME